MITLPIDIRWIDLLDIFIVSVLLYYILLWLQGTRAVPLVRGLILILFIYFLGKVLRLYTISWLFDKFVAVIVMMLIVIFQPELRRTLERFGRGKLLGSLGFAPPSRSGLYVRQIVRAVEQLSESRMGALIVVEKVAGLAEYLESGIRLDAALSAELLISIFNSKSPLHDGAVIIQGERILAASCLLPLSESRLLDKRLGTRHRAAIGLTEVTDALAVVVSEKSGVISLAENGYLTRFLTKDLLEEKLLSLYKTESVKNGGLFKWRKQKAAS